MSDTWFSPCGDHQALNGMEFHRALKIANECPSCYVEQHHTEPTA